MAKVRRLRNKSKKKCAMLYLEFKGTVKDTVKGSVGMKHRILKRVIALCIAGCVMALTLAACGDSEENNEGKETVQDVSQDVAQEDEDGTVGVNENGDAVNVDSSGNDVRVAHASSSGNSGNGFAIPVFKPGEEPDPGQELQSDTGTQHPQSNAGVQSGTGTQKPQQSQSNTGAQTSAGTQTSGGTQSGAGTQTAHTHNFQGGNCTTPATCSCGATGNYGSHNWATKTVHHDATGHWEKKVTQALFPNIDMVYKCTICNYQSAVLAEVMQHIRGVHNKDGLDAMDYWTWESVETYPEIIKDVWVEDTAAWDEKVTACSICGAMQ